MNYILVFEAMDFQQESLSIIPAYLDRDQKDKLVQNLANSKFITTVYESSSILNQLVQLLKEHSFVESISSIYSSAIWKDLIDKLESSFYPTLNELSFLILGDKYLETMIVY